MIEGNPDHAIFISLIIITFTDTIYQILTSTFC